MFSETSVQLAEINESGIVKISQLQEFKYEEEYELDHGLSFVDTEKGKIILYGTLDRGKKYRSVIVSY